MSNRPGGDGRFVSARTPLIDVNVSHEHGPAPSTRRLSEAVEIVTANHIYVLDSALRCIEVRKASSTTSVTDSSFLGSRLVGGQLNTDDAIELSYPFPRPGALAVFEVRKGRARQFHCTSPVTRVVMRLSIVTVTKTRVIPTWEEISRAVHPDDQ
jgi:hypothetical protein